VIAETLEWFTPAEKLPDDETTVLVKLANKDVPYQGEPVWPGYLDDEGWHLADGMPLEEPPALWTVLPGGEATP
jgi:hypothetical protein